jgi:UrcA family protein
MYKFHKAASWLAVGSLMSAALMANPANSIPEAAPTIRVNYADLDLNRAQDVKRLYGRIRIAAITVCRSAQGPELVNRLFWNDWHACMDKAIGSAIDTVHNPQLSAHYAANDRQILTE